MFPSKQARAHNSRVCDAVRHLVKQLDVNKAIIGRADDRLYLRPDKIPSAMFEEMDCMRPTLVEAENPEVNHPVFARFVSNNAIAILSFSDLVSDMDARTNAEIPFVQDVRRLLNSPDELNDSHIEELQFLLMPQREYPA